MKSINKFLSTLSLRRATVVMEATKVENQYFYPRSPCGERHPEPDRCPRHPHFYPRSPCGERLLLVWQPKMQPYFYPRSPCGERPEAATTANKALKFLSTLSLRRATAPQQENGQAATISIHALLAESDRPRCHDHRQDVDFYPRSPCGERRQQGPEKS